jgi:hypothetical protein
MTSTIIPGLGEKAAERWTAALFGPSTLFWTGGLALWLLDERSWNDSAHRIIDWFDGLTGTEQVLVAFGALLLVTTFDALVRQFTLPMLQLLEGYGLLVRLPWTTHYQSRRLSKANAELESLLKGDLSKLSPKELNRYSTVAEFVRRSPGSSAFLMPTGLGNILRAAETWPRDKYGLDAIICWPRLWLTLSDEVRSEISKARTEIDQAVVYFIWGLLLLVWSLVFLNPFVALTTIIVTAVICTFAYWWAKQRAKAFADLIEATFDLYRAGLYDALRFEKPEDPSDEPAVGENLTAYLWWRKTSKKLEFVEEMKPEVGCGAEDTTPKRAG